MVMMNLFVGQQQTHRHREQTCRHSGRGGKGDGKEVQEGGDMGVPMADSC